MRVVRSSSERRKDIVGDAERKGGAILSKKRVGGVAKECNILAEPAVA